MNMELLRVNQEAMQVTQAKTERSLQRWVAIGMKEGRNQRRRSREIDHKITQLASSQLLTEEALKKLAATLQRFLERGSNGAPKANPQ